jgi:Xaa-Pro aminopeptidase
MVSNEAAQQLYPLLQAKKSKLVYPSQNLIDLIWEGKPLRSKNKIFVQPIEYTGKKFTLECLYFVTHSMFTGKDASRKLAYVRDWMKAYTPPSGASPSRNPPSQSQRHVGTLISSLASIGQFAFCY